MTRQQAQKIIDDAAKSQANHPSAYWMLQLLRDRPELLVVIDEVEALLKADCSGTWLKAMQPFTKEKS